MVGDQSLVECAVCGVMVEVSEAQADTETSPRQIADQDPSAVRWICSSCLSEP